METLRLEAVVFVPARLSPHKYASAASAEDRWQMLQLAIAGEPQFFADDFELRREPPSFTFHTLEHFRGRFPQTPLFFFLGEDNLSEFHTWHRAEDLPGLATFVILAREEVRPAEEWRSDRNLALLEHGSTCLRISRHLQISSSEIRARVARGLSIRYMVPEPVREYIVEHRLYA